MPILAFLLVFGLCAFDAPLYTQPVVRVTFVNNDRAQRAVDNFDNVDHTTKQHITGQLLNTSRRGHLVRFGNTFSASGAMDARLRTGQSVFVQRQNGGYQMLDVKRDGVVLGLLAATLVLMALVVKRRVWLTFGSLFANVLLLLVTLHLETSPANQQLAYLLFSCMAVLFTLVTTVFIAGFSRQAAVIATATIGATGLAVALGYALFSLTNYRDLHIEAMNYVTQVPQLLFFVQIIIGSLGAVLDESNDIAVAVMQLPHDPKRRFKAGMAIGRNVMGPLIAVLFMIFIADTFSESILWLRNDNALTQTFIWVMGLGFAQALVSAFGIVLAVPLTAGLATIAGKGAADEHI
ncbi:multitransmembrane protein [Lacticaseibacillus camelliae DSM 22697 = JCM 13995]|uniref:Multitransmembrane protein n=1 Tax=Lacticaseibacillus camelliae DSM 22697 = JCM 13995 TaxID=1423730 RepID=A0A0R2F484_9LACO|nr:multitransmembrane protein [Lacticaseibacillus camelliae DSM 22697 = JCM 13995]